MNLVAMTQAVARRKAPLHGVLQKLVVTTLASVAMGVNLKNVAGKMHKLFFPVILAHMNFFRIASVHNKNTQNCPQKA